MSSTDISNILKQLDELSQPRQLPALFKPQNISPVLGSPEKKNPMSGYFVGGEGAEPDAKPVRYAIRHRETGRTLSSHKDEAAARDEMAGLGDRRREYKLVKTSRRPNQFGLDEEDSGGQQYAVTIDAIDHGVLSPITVTASSPAAAKQKAIASATTSMAKRGYELQVRSAAVKSAQGMAEGDEPGYVKYEQMKDKISGVLIKLYKQGKDAETIKQMGGRVAKHLGYDPTDSIYQDAWLTSFNDASLDGSLDQDSDDDYTDYSMRQGERGNPGKFSEQGVAEGLDQDIPSVLYHATYKPRLKSIQSKGLGSGGKRNWEDSQRGVVYLALDPDVAESYAETSDMVPDEWLDQIVMLKISTVGLDSNKFGIDSNVQDNAGDTIEYHGVIPVSNISLYKSGVAEGSGQTVNLDDLDKLINRTDYNLARKGDPARYDDVEVDKRTKIIYWVTQETTTKQSQEFAIRLANILKNNGFNGWTVKVVRRDFYNGKRSPWKVASVEQGVAEGMNDWALKDKPKAKSIPQTSGMNNWARKGDVHNKAYDFPPTYYDKDGKDMYGQQKPELKSQTKGMAEAKVIGHVSDVAGHGKVVQCAKCDTDLRDDHGFALDNGTYICRSGKCSMRQAKNRLAAMAARGEKPRWRKDEDVAEGLDDNGISFRVQKGKNKFATTLSVGSNPVGVYQYDATTGRSIAEVYPEFKGKGLGKLLVLHAIYTAAKLGLDFQEDESRTSEYDNVLDSLSSNGYIVDDDGYWYVTGEGEQYLNQSLKQGVAEGNYPNYPKEPDLDQDKRDFKRQELQHELGHERNNYAVVIDGRTWKVFADQRKAQNIARNLKSRGKNASVQETGASPTSESIEEVNSPGTANKKAWDKGHEAGYTGNEKCPCKPGSAEEKAWNAGHKVGRDERSHERHGGDKYNKYDESMEASPMIKPPSNRFDSKQEAFAHAKTHGGKVFKSTYTDPNTGNKNVSFVVKKDQDVEEGLKQKLAAAALAGSMAMGASAGGVSLPGSGGSFTPDAQQTLNQRVQATKDAEAKDHEESMARWGIGYLKGVVAAGPGSRALVPYEDAKRELARRAAAYELRSQGDQKTNEQGVAEVAPPGAEAERMVKHIKQGYAKDGKLTGKEKAIAYATTWKAHNQGQVEEASTDQVGFHLDTERAYNAVMERFGDVVEQDQESGMMTVPRRYWPQLEQVAHDADGIGAIEAGGEKITVDEVEESYWQPQIDEAIAQEDVLDKEKRHLGDYLQSVADAVKHDAALSSKDTPTHSSDTIGSAVKTVTTDDGHDLKIHGNEDDGFRISIKGRPSSVKFKSLDEAGMACEMYRSHRRHKLESADYIEEQ